MDTTAIIKDNLAGEAYCGKWDEIISEGAFCRYRKVSSIKGGFLSEKSKGLRWTNNYSVTIGIPWIFTSLPNLPNKYAVFPS